MAILLDEKTEVVVQGITGREGKMRARIMLAYGTRIVAGVTPGKSGEKVFDIPVYNTVEEAKEHHPNLSASAVFVPARAAKEAAFESIDAGMRLIALFAERLPQQDMIEIIAYSKESDCVLIGPNTPGLVSPGKALLGMLGGTVEMARSVFKAGQVGVLSRSGGNTTTLCHYLNEAGLGQTTAIGTGGDAFVGATWCDLLTHFEKDPDTKLIAAFGEIGTTIEEDVAEFITQGKFTKPMVAYISGKYAKEGIRFGHAGAMILGGKGTAVSKIRALRDAGVNVVPRFSDIGTAAKEILGSYKEGY